ncbi:MAG TPA: hypothetical protein VM617_08685 [Thermoanaerobaculia bacterium]|nr:hypothetical protein [Thermoanaerobaculia bacterium]
MRFPLSLQFKILAFAPQITVRDADGSELLYVHQKLFKLKEQIKVYRDSGKGEIAYQIAADRVLDFSARYAFTEASGASVGSVKRSGMKSLWRAHYEVADAAGQAVLTIGEDNPAVKLLDGLLGEIPVIGMASGYFLHPRYTVAEHATSHPVLRVSKRRSFLEAKFTVTAEPAAAGLSPEVETAAVLAILTMALLERSRG